MGVVTSKLKLYGELVKFEHTIFALPFALSAMVLAAPAGQFPPAAVWCWVILAMVGGRTFAMALNRLIDAEIDGQNPRTSSRTLPAGRMKKLEAWGLVMLSAVLLMFATFQLPVVCQQLLPVAFLILTIYSYVKRFSALAHLVLGVALGSSAVGGWLAVTGELTWLPVLFGFAVVFWVSGFDIIYASQDESFDRKAGLHSIPVALGLKNAFLLSRVFHTLTIVCLMSFGFLSAQAGLGFWSAVYVTAFMLIYEHRIVTWDNLERLDEAFFMVNGRISLMVFFCVLIDKLVTVIF